MWFSSTVHWTLSSLELEFVLQVTLHADILFASVFVNGVCYEVNMNNVLHSPHLHRHICQRDNSYIHFISHLGMEDILADIQLLRIGIVHRFLTSYAQQQPDFTFVGIFIHASPFKCLFVLTGSLYPKLSFHLCILCLHKSYSVTIIMYFV